MKMSLKGSSWVGIPINLRASCRGCDYPDSRINLIGFRVACEVPAVRVLRGGSWHLNPYNLRASSRLRHDPDARYLNLGFRVACEVIE